MIVMKEILLIARNDGQCSEWALYLNKHIQSEIVSKSFLAPCILTKDYRILIRPNTESCYQGRQPDYHYAYGFEVNSYLLSTGSRRLRSLDDVVNIVKGENMDKQKYIVEFESEEPLILNRKDWSDSEWDTVLKIFNLQRAECIHIDSYSLSAFAIGGLKKGQII